MAKNRAPKKVDWTLWLFGAGLLCLVGLTIWATRPAPSYGEPAGVITEKMMMDGAEVKVEAGKLPPRFRHVQPGTKVDYLSDPPLQGDHYGVVPMPGVYTDPQAPAALVHALEHGNVVIYYDPDRTPGETVDMLRSITRRINGSSPSGGQWDGLILTPRKDPTYQVTLTAWLNKLGQETFHEQNAMAFIEKFRGRGPEHPVR